MAELTVMADASKLNKDGRFLIDAASRQSSLLKAAHTPKDDHIIVQIWDNDRLGSDDTLSIIVRSTISFSDRCRKYGISGLDVSQAERDEAGQLTWRRGPDGFLIPSESYITALVKVYGDDFQESRRWAVPRDVCYKVRKALITGTEAINWAGEAFRQWLQDGQFEVA